MSQHPGILLTKISQCNRINIAKKNIYEAIRIVYPALSRNRITFIRQIIDQLANYWSVKFTSSEVKESALVYSGPSVFHGLMHFAWNCLCCGDLKLFMCDTFNTDQTCTCRNIAKFAFRRICWKWINLQQQN